MRRWMLVVLAVVLLAPAALGQQWIENLPVNDDGWVEPDELVVAQEVRVHDSQADCALPTTSFGTWDTPGNAELLGGGCTQADADGEELWLEDFGFAIPVGAEILGITVEVLCAVDGNTGLDVQLWNQAQRAPVEWSIVPPPGLCPAVAPRWAGGADELWGFNWTPDQINNNLRVRIVADLDGGSDAFIDVVEVCVTYAEESTIEEFRVRNGAGGDGQLTGEQIEKIEIYRIRDDRVIGSQTRATELDDFTTTGVLVDIGGANQEFTGTEDLRIRIQLRDDVPLGTFFWLGDTFGTIDGTEYAVTYGVDAEWFEVGPSPVVAFDDSVDDANVFPGQRFLAGRIDVEAFDTPFELEIDELLLVNDAPGTALAGTHIDALEIRRATDGALLGDATATELAKLTTDGTSINTNSNNTVSAYGSVLLELWVTLDEDAPTGQQLRFADHILISGAEFQVGDDDPVGDEGPLFTIGEPGGFEEVNNVDLDLGDPRVYSGQRFLAQRIEVVDVDDDPYDVTTTSLTVQNISPDDRLAENQIDKIEVVRARDGALMGETTDVSGLNTAGVRIQTTDANLAEDDTVENIEIWVTLDNDVPHERFISLDTTVWHTENARDFRILAIGPASEEFETGPAVGEGFEEATAATVANGGVFQSVRFLAQELKLEDDDLDPYGITITSLMIRNMAPDNRLSSNNVARVEVRRKSDGLLLGEVIDPINLHLAGERVATAINNTVLDDDIVELEIWLTLKAVIPFGRKIELESIVWHREGTVTFETDPLEGPTTFTTEEGDPPTNVDFTWDPELPRFDEEITFDPADDIADPEGAIGNATFDWEFGDGATDQTEGPADVLHTYDDGGTFAVTLTVTGEDGLSTSVTHDIEVEGPPNTPPEITEIEADPQSPAVDANVEFTITIVDDDQPEGLDHIYAWDFDDGDTSDAASPRHAFDEAGTYTVEVTVTDDEGATDTATIEIAVGNDPPTLTRLDATPTTSNTGDAVVFNAIGYDDPNDDPLGEYRWDFDDGTKTATDGTNADTTTHVFGAPGIYTVSVVAVDDRGAESAGQTVQIEVSGPLQAIVYGFPNPASFAATITWFLPDGATNPILRVYNLLRGLVFEQALAAGATQFAWDLRSTAGDVLPNGLYFCVVSATSAAGRNISSEIFRLLIAR